MWQPVGSLRARAKCGAYPALHSRSQLGRYRSWMAGWTPHWRLMGSQSWKEQRQFDCQITGRHQGHKQRKAHKTCAIQPWSCELKNPSRLSSAPIFPPWSAHPAMQGPSEHIWPLVLGSSSTSVWPGHFGWKKRWPNRRRGWRRREV